MELQARTSLNRREFFSYLAVGWITFAAAATGLVSLIFRFFYPNVVFEPAMDFVAGTPDQYDSGVDERWKNLYGVWIYKNDGKIVALSVICTHLGCVPAWLAAESKYKCPCHGSGFYANGINFEGPAPRPLERFKIFMDPSGNIVVDKTKMFKQEKGEWTHPDSFVAV